MHIFFPDLITIAFCLQLQSASSAVTAYITTTITNQKQSSREEERRRKWDTVDFHPTNKHGLDVCVPPKFRWWNPNSPAMESAGTLILDFPAPGLYELNTCCLSHLTLGISLQQPKLTENSGHIVYFVNTYFHFQDLSLCSYT